MSDVVIVASAFGVDAIRRDGHEAWLATAVSAGAAGFEVRRELFVSEAQAARAALRSLGQAIDASGMWSVYSTPATLYTATGALDEPALRLAVEEADALGARFVKLQLGGWGNENSGSATMAGAPRREAAHKPVEDVPGGDAGNRSDASRERGAAQGARIATCMTGSRARLVVENGQLAEGGLINQFAGLFAALRTEDCADVLGMTFDIGNWQWPGEAPIEAARQLAGQVEYIHCKAVTGNGARRFAVAPATDDPVCAAVLPLLPRNVPRGIEFPFDPSGVAAEASHYVRWLAEA
jgi:sugar phosphate isomerase/epimerase